MPTLQDEPSKFKCHCMPFGLHSGLPLNELPDEYICWLANLVDLRQPLVNRVLQEMARRLAALLAAAAVQP